LFCRILNMPAQMTVFKRFLSTSSLTNASMRIVVSRRNYYFFFRNFGGIQMCVLFLILLIFYKFLKYLIFIKSCGHVKLFIIFNLFFIFPNLNSAITGEGKLKLNITETIIVSWDLSVRRIFNLFMAIIYRKPHRQLLSSYRFAIWKIFFLYMYIKPNK
jgi:hypothetical protein